MKDHPDEFLMRRKWDELINEFGEYFTEEELNAYKAARNEMMRDLFNESVLKRLAGEEDEGKTMPGTVPYNAQGRYHQAWGDPRSAFGQLANTPIIAAKQVNAAMQQQAYLQSNSSLAQSPLERDWYMEEMQKHAYHTAAQQRVYSEQQGLIKDFPAQPWL